MWNRIESGACAALLLITCLLDARFPQDNGQRERLQRVVDRAIGGRHGALIVADVASGDLVAAQGMEIAAHRLERPGSAVKPFVLKALLESGKIDAGQKLMCRRPLRIGGAKMDCAHTASVVELNAEEAIAYSCNSYFAEAVLRFSGAELTQALRKAGLDSPSGLNKEEAVGRIELPTSRETLQLEALGERGIEVTAVELLGAYRKLALEKRTGVNALDSPVFAGLEESVSYGMAHAAFVDGMKVAGKTGTAASRTSAATHGFFAGYAPAEKPEIVIVVFVEQGHGGDAAAIAQPVFAEFAGSRQLP
jgi:cell division protein FtsI/penicillin-binding protein 2